MGFRRVALCHALCVLALIAAAHAVFAPLSHGLRVAAAALQMYWPMVALEHEGLRNACIRLYVRGAIDELRAAAFTLLVSVPPWAWVTLWLVPQATIPRAWPAIDGPVLVGALEMAMLAGQEEWFWRGHVQAAFGHSSRGIVLSSIVFAACHWAFSGSVLALSTVFPSFVFGALARRNHRLLACTCVHIGYNVASRTLVPSG